MEDEDAVKCPIEAKTEEEGAKDVDVKDVLDSSEIQPAPVAQSNDSTSVAELAQSSPVAQLEKFAPVAQLEGSSPVAELGDSAPIAEIEESAPVAKVDDEETLAHVEIPDLTESKDDEITEQSASIVAVGDLNKMEITTDSPADPTVTSTTDEQRNKLPAHIDSKSIVDVEIPVIPEPIIKPIIHHEINVENSDEVPSRRKFRLMNLTMSALESSIIRGLLDEAQSFHMWFEQQPNSSRKLGGVSVAFEMVDRAKWWFEEVKSLSFDGHAVKHQAPKGYYEQLAETERREKEDANDPDLPCKIYISQLLPSTQEDLIRPIFGADSLKSIDIKLDPRRRDGSKEAIVTFHTAELANQAREDYDNFSIDDGEVSRLMKILPLSVHLKRVRENKHVPHKESTPPQIQRQEDLSQKYESDHYEEKTVGEVQGLINQTIVAGRTNWAELNDAQELWNLLDEVCTQHGWIEEETLKEALLSLMTKDVRECNQDWMFNHLQRLVKCWKKECSKPSRSNKSHRKFQLEAPEYQPPIVKPKENKKVEGRKKEKKEENKKEEIGKQGANKGETNTEEGTMPKKPENLSRKKQVMGLMGIGALLAQVKQDPPKDPQPVKEPEPEKSKRKRKLSDSSKNEKKSSKGKKRKNREEESSDSDEEKKPANLEEGEMESGGESSSGESDSSSESNDSDDSASKSDDDSTDDQQDCKKHKKKSNRKERRACARKRVERSKSKRKEGNLAESMMPTMFGMMQQMLQTRMQMMHRPTMPNAPQTTPQMQHVQMAFQQFQQQTPQAQQYAYTQAPQTAPYYSQQPPFFRPN